MPKDLFVCALLDVYGAFLSEKQRALAEYYYNDDLSLAEIAENEGISRQGVQDIVKRAEAQLRHLEECCGYCETFSRLKQLAAQVGSGDGGALPDLLRLIDGL